MRRARFTPSGVLAIERKAWGIELDEVGAAADRGFTQEGDCAIVDIRGPLLRRAEGFWALFCDDYESILERARAAFASPARRVVLRIDSPGGEAAGCFEAARELRALSESTKKPLLAYTDGCCASAAYALATAAARIVCSSTADVGSIGVFEAMIDWTEQQKAYGLNVLVVASGEEKTDRNPDVPITKEAVARVQSHVDQFAALFFALCAEMRGGSPADYQALRGGIFLGAAALGVRLVDAVSGWAEALAGPQPPQETTMGDSKKSFDSAKEALRAVVDDEKCSEDEREKARKSLRALEAEPEKQDGDGGGDEKKKDDEASKAKAEEDKKKDDEAKALAASSVAMAKELQELKAKDAERDRREAAEKDAQARAALFAKRPDFSEAQRATLALVPLAEVQKAVDTWPRVNVEPGASTNALTPSASGGEPSAKAAYQPRLTVEEQRLLDKVSGKKAPGPKAAVRHGNVTQMPAGITQAEARARLAELEKEPV